MKTPRTVASTITVLALITLAGCGGGSDSGSENAVAPDYQADTSYLDDLAEDKGIDTSEPDPAEPVEIDQTQIAAEPENDYKDEDREWVEEDGSKSLLGRARDRGKDIRDQIQGGTEPENGIANTTYDEEYAQAAGFAWDMPEDWRMAVPSAGHFGEMFIKHPLGNASVVFEKTEWNSSQTKRELQKYITDMFGSSDAHTSIKTVNGFSVTIFDLEGTYIDPSGKGGRNESPFYAIHAALIELPTTKVLIRMWGPQDTVNQNKAKFDKMIENMYEK